MAKISKSGLSMYLRSGCQRQLALNLYSTGERRDHGMPHSLRDPELGLVAKAGNQWQLERVNQLKRACGDDNVKSGPLNGEVNWAKAGCRTLARVAVVMSYTGHGY